LNIQDVVVSGNAEVVTSKVEGHIWEAVTLVAVNGVLAVVALLGTHLLVEELSKRCWEGNERGSGVKDDAGVLQLGSRIAEADRVEVNLPVSLASQGDLDQFAGVVALVGPAEDGLGLGLGITEVESENRVIQKTLVDHVVEGRGDLVDGDGVVSQTQDAVESTKGKGKTGLLGGLGEELVLDLEVTNGHDIAGNESAQASGAVLDGEGRPVLRVGRRRGGVILCVKETGDRATLGGGHPQVGASGIEDDLEGLRGGSDGDLGEVWDRVKSWVRSGSWADLHWAFKKLLTGTV